ncbi:ABC transporter permease [Caproiciproducens sp. CPB-2]|uniref:ABC transporter permease n=1 Tax=Caproiciproducens sp. CPB-2 TaxID=3030017 RepID=UPI0023DCD852|nr:ABC transporter permease [Caproiciproducens sp. CPB-2]MDF1493645.1 ABC transporter permease [Caproiciproducens sp. CPB-2]
MTSKTSSIRRRKEFWETYLWSLKKNRGMMALLTLLMFIALPMILMILMANTQNRITTEVYTPEMWTQAYLSSVTGLTALLVTPMALIFVLVISVSLFGYMHQKRSVDLFHALPVGRTPMILGRLLAGLTALYAPILLNFALIFVVGAAYPVQLPLCWVTVFSYLLWLLLICAAALCLSSFMAVCTGMTTDMILSLLGINAAYPLLIFLGDRFASSLLPGLHTGLTPSSLIMTALSPFMAAFMPYIVSGSQARSGVLAVDTGFYIWWIVFTLVLLAGTVLLYRKRRSECAESSFAFSLPKNGIRFMITAVTGLGLGLLLQSGTESSGNFFIGLIAGSLAAHIVTETIYSRGFKQLKKSFVGYGVFMAVFVAAYAFLATGALGYDTRVPLAEDVASVTVRDPYTNNGGILDGNHRLLASITPTLTEKANIAKVTDFHKKIVQDKRSHSYPYSLNGGNGTSFTLTYHLKNGGAVDRTYYFEYKNDGQGNPISPLGEIADTREYKETQDLLFYVEPEYMKSVDLEPWSGEESTTFAPDLNTKKELLDAMRQDYLDGKLSNGKNLAADSSYLVIEYKSPLQVKDGKLKALLNGYEGDIYLYMNSYNFLNNSSKTGELVEKLGWNK